MGQYPVVVEDGECNRRFPNPPRTDESDGLKVYGEFDDLLNKLASSETVSRGRGR